MLDRGWTGHEYFAAVHLVYMNGRMYDTDLRRFLSPDNYVQDPTNTQNYNRYKYGLNNPLKYSDLNGEFLGALIFIGITFLKGALIGGAAYAIFSGKHFTWRGLGNAALWGGIGAVASAGIGAATKALAGILSTGNSLAVQAFNVGAHFATGGLLTSLQGGNFSSGGLSDGFAAIAGFKAGALTRNSSKFVKKIAYYVSGALSGGVGSLLGHGNFGSGAARGAIVTGLNHLVHSIEGRMYAKRAARQQAIARLRAVCERIVAQGNGGLGDPPWDLNGNGKLSKYEADRWGIYHGGEAITVNENKIDLTGFNVKHLTGGANGIYGYPTTKVFQDLSWETASVYGGSVFKLVDGQWQMQSQEYHYRYRPMNSFENIARNIMTFMGYPGGSPNAFSGASFRPFFINIVYD